MWLHFEKNFGVPKNSIPFLYLEHGVSFFFVLSGFILTYNYPSFSSALDIKKFYLNRVARIWPLHALMLIFALIMLPENYVFLFPQSLFQKIKIISANIFLVHSWIPNSKYYLSGNAVSWSVSLEVFFYLTFPLLVKNLAETWWKKLLGSFLIVVFVLFLCWFFSVPNHTKEYDGISILGLVYAGPLVRVLEFVLGVVTCHFYFKNRENRVGKYKTHHEFLALFVALASMCASYFFSLYVGFWPLVVWLYSSGSLLGFAYLIYVFAQSSGIISKMLSKRIFVYLGEISFSLYMIHSLPLLLYDANGETLFGWPNPVKMAFFLILSVLLAALGFEVVEKPARKWFLSKISLII